MNTKGKLHLLKDIMDFDDYNQFISDIKMFLKAGDAYQINFTDYKYDFSLLGVTSISADFHKYGQICP